MPRATKLQQGKSGKLASKRSKTADPACSAAVSKWKTSGMTPDVASTLARCRAMASNKKKATLQREAGNEGKAQVLERRAERGMTGKDRLAKAKELIAARKSRIDAQVQAKAAPATQAKPSLREQADAARAKKGGVAERAKAFADRNTQFGKPGTYSGRKTVDVNLFESKGPRYTDRSVSRGAIKIEETGKGSKQFAVTKRAYGENARSSKTVAVTTSVAEAKDYVKGQVAGLFEGRYQRLRDNLAAKAPVKPSPLQQAAAARTAKGDRTTRLKALAERSMSLAESRATRAGSLSGAAQDRMIDRSMLAASRYNALEVARAPYKPATTPAVPAIKSGLPTTKGGLPAETPKLSLLEQARAKRAQKNAGGNRAGSLAAKAQKRYQAASRNMKSNTKKGDLDRAVKYATSANANAGRFEKLVAIHTSGGKFVTARVVK